MACSSREKYGYEDELFEKDIDPNFHCPICRNVFKDPRMCENNEHIFCIDCITEHLRVNSKTCPQCKDKLTVETLRRPPRLLTNLLSELKIKCDYFRRGCRKFIRLEELATHVKDCRFATAKSPNEACRMVINKREKTRHETAVCEQRNVKCRSCRQMEVDVEEIKLALGCLVQANEISNDKVEAVNKEIETMNTEVKAVKEEVKAVKGYVDVRVEALKEDVQRVKESIEDVNSSMSWITVMMSEALEKLSSLELKNQEASSVGEAANAVSKDILVAGGFGAERYVEKFCRKENMWMKVTLMNARHAQASSFAYQNQIFVVGGFSSDARSSVEIMNARDEIIKWTEFLGSLPYSCCNHQTVVYQHRMILIGGFNCSISKPVRSIFAVHLTPPYTCKPLGEMPEPRMFHCAETFENKVLILGGRQSQEDAHSLDSVLEFNVNRNECKEMPSLPRATSDMATVRWKNSIVVMGGRNKNGKALNDVLTYDCKTGKSDVLPSMLEKRYACCAVITGDTVVVIGGYNQNRKRLNSVESLKLGDTAWKYLPATNEARSYAIAEVLP